MSRIAMALVLFGLAAWVASGARDGLRDGEMPFVWLGGVNPFVFDRVQSPAWFWGAAIVNVALGAAFALAAILILAAGPR